MNEWWRMRMGTTGIGFRRQKSKKTPAASKLEPEDFYDVFGGPPRSVLARKLSANFIAKSDWFYKEMFRQPVTQVRQDAVAGRIPPEFSIPERGRLSEGKDSRYSWRNYKSKFMLRSKSTSWSAQSFEELNHMNCNLPVGSQDREDVALSSFTSKLRPINVPDRWYSLSTASKPKKQELPPLGSTKTTYKNSHENHCNNYMLETFNPGFPHEVASPETINMDSIYRLEVPTTMDDYEMMQQLESPSSVVSEAKMNEFNYNGVFDMSFWRPEEVDNSEAIDISEAIAWAKEKFQG